MQFRVVVPFPQNYSNKEQISKRQQAANKLNVWYTTSLHSTIFKKEKETAPVYSIKISVHIPHANLVEACHEEKPE